jgi:hypothetical protein
LHTNFWPLVISALCSSCIQDNKKEEKNLTFKTKGLTTLVYLSEKPGFSLCQIESDCQGKEQDPIGDSADFFISNDSLYAPLGMQRLEPLRIDSEPLPPLISCDSTEKIFHAASSTKVESQTLHFQAPIQFNQGYRINTRSCGPVAIVPVGTYIGGYNRLQVFWGR